MALIDEVLEGAALIARQAATTTAAGATTTTGFPTPTDTATTPPVSGTATATGPSTTPFVSGQSSLPPTSTFNVLPTTNGTDSGGGGGGGGGGNSPLLFFVALGFGVVFTNLWIIVGVKYCFRYNARARQMRLAAEDGEPINMENMPRPHRRRREKKLMTIDEVNEKFPMMKYKSWVASRAQEGLPTRGGVDMPSRANSVRSVEGAIPDLQPKERESSDDSKKNETTTTITATTTADDASTVAVGASYTNNTNTSATITSRKSTQESRAETVDNADAETTGDASLKKGLTHTSEDYHDHDHDDDDEQIDAALPPELVGTTGDTCAICIDTLEDDDDVRGLTCGHAFHAVCIDPWLTTRRACCPLCKADYYTPKPRPQPGEPGADGQNGAQGNSNGPIIIALSRYDGRRNRMNMPSRPRGAWLGSRFPSRMGFATGTPNNGSRQDAPVEGTAAPIVVSNGDVLGPVAGGPEVPPQRMQDDGNSRWMTLIGRPRTAPQQEPQQTSPSTSSFGSRFVNRLRSSTRRNSSAAEQPAPVTPGQLEAGVRRA